MKYHKKERKKRLKEKKRITNQRLWQAERKDDYLRLCLQDHQNSNPTAGI